MLKTYRTIQSYIILYKTLKKGNNYTKEEGGF